MAIEESLLHAWNDEYELGHENVDLQHHTFFNLVFEFRTLINNSTDIQLRHKLSELYAYARFHFISEENLMQQSGYPDENDHHQLHADLLNKLIEAERMLTISKSQSQVREFMHFLEAWFLEHTQVHDRNFTEWLASQ